MLALATWSGSAFAQEAGPGEAVGANAAGANGLADIVVTARKRSESLSNVPVSVSALPEATINAFVVSELKDYTALIPGIFLSQGGLESNLYIRGTGTAAVNVGFENSVGVYLDGNYTGKAPWMLIGNVDIQRVEVLKGPQPLYFGKNAVAGAVNLITNDPTDKFEGSLKASYDVARTNEKKITGVVSGPLATDLTGRLALEFRDSDGFIKGTLPSRKDAGGVREYFARGSLKYAPSPDFSILWKATYGNYKVVGITHETYGCDAPYAFFVNLFPPGDDCTINGHQSETGYAGALAAPNRPKGIGAKIEALSLDQTIQAKIGQFNLVSATSYKDNKFDKFGDADYSPIPLQNFSRKEPYRQFTQELRLSSPQMGIFSFVLGGYYERSRLRADSLVDITGLALGGPPVPAFTIAHLNVQHGTSAAVFGEAYLDLPAHLRLSLGGRYSYEKKTGDLAMSDFPFDIGAAVVRGPYNVNKSDLRQDDPRFKDTNVSPSVTLQWKPSADTMVYGSFKKGFKAGGLNLDSFGYTVNYLPSRTFKSETVDSYEVGFRSKFLDNKASVALTAFHSKYKNLQVSTYDGVFGLTPRNAGSSISKGIELETRILVARGLTLGASGTLLDSHYSSFPNAGCPADSLLPATALCDFSGRRTAFAPKRSASLNADYKTPLTDGLNLELGGVVQYSSRYYTEVTEDRRSLQNSYARVNARIGIAESAGRWELALAVKNLTNKKVKLVSTLVPSSNQLPVANAGAWSSIIDDPRQVFLTASVNF